MDTFSKTAAVGSLEQNGIFSRFVTGIVNWGVRIGERRALTELNARSLADIGLDPEKVEREIARSLWD